MQDLQDSILPFGVDHKVDMWVMPCVVKSGIPLKITQWDFVCFGYGGHISSDQGFPTVRGIVSQSLRILSVKAHDMCPDIAVMVS